ncbi:hypothetical protein Rhal01_02547 [Rubritalea halochordaticola]|uniref:Uncharacterized protein n=1 Tax=Rubritalea halochordaticola TaxID=714537 RepID=A0ABP9V0Z2_9BACT
MKTHPLTKAGMLCLSLALLATPLAAEKMNRNDYCKIRYSHFDDKVYAFGLTKEAYRKMAVWRFDQGAPPPISAQQAHGKARAWIDTLEKSPGWKWELDQIALEPIDQNEGKWLWLVSFEYKVTEGGQTGQPIRMHVYVTMNGDLIQPVVSEMKRRSQ